MNWCRQAIAVPTAVSALCLVYMCELLLSNFDRGIGLTDEALYISLARYPSALNFIVSGFGYFTGALLDVAGGSIFLFRVYGLVVLMVVTLYFALGIEHFLRGPGYKLRDGTSRILAILCFGLTYYFAWIVTPSYNWLTLVALLAMSGSALLAVGRIDRLMRTLLLFLVGCFGAIAFLAKPPSGAVAAVAYIVLVLAACPRGRLPALAIAGLGAAAVVGGYVWRAGGAREVIGAALRGLDMAATLGGGHSASLGGYVRVDRPIVGLAGLISAALISLWLACRIGLVVGWRTVRLAGAIVIGGAAIAFASQGMFAAGEQNYRRFVFPVLLLAVSAWIFATISIFVADNAESHGVYRRLNVFAVFGVLIMVAYAAGSAVDMTNNLAGVLVVAGATMAYAAYVCDRSAAGWFGGTVNIILSLIAADMLYTAHLDPFVLTRPLQEQTEPILLQGRRHLVDPEMARFVNELQSSATRAGWKPGMPLVNLTGNSPITTVLLDGRFVSSPWLLGGYSGSLDYAHKALSFADLATLRAAWLVTTPSGERPVEPQVMDGFGMKFPDDYEQVAVVTMGFKAVPAQRIPAWTENQVLWKPRTKTP